MSADVQTLAPSQTAVGGTLQRTVAASAPRLLYAVFVLSGAAGLIYESIWSRYLGLFLGHSAYAQVLVLSIFLGGMSAGAMLAARRSERLAKPLLWYAGIELGAGVIGLLFHSIYTGVTGFALATIFPALSDSATLLTLAKWTIGALLILPQSLLLGATFPLMSAGVVRHLPRQPGRTIAALYFANSIGAAGGVLLSGFWLVPWVGLPGTVLTAALFNIAVAVVAYYVARALPPEAAVAPQAGLAPSALQASSLLSRPALSALLLGVAFGTAVASFVYEITWIRMLSLVLGSATHSFELMLSAFILGLALGALSVRSFADTEALPLRALAQVQWAMGAFALATLPVYVASFGWTADLLQTFGRTPEGYTGFNLARYALCLAVMLPATFCAGMTLPLITRTLLTSGWGERAVGWVYSVNTLGSILGAALAGLVLLPLFGLKPLLILGCTVDMLLGVALFAVASESRAAGAKRALVFGTGTALIAAVLGWGTPLDQALLSSGVFRLGMLPAPGSRQILFHEDGRTSSVAVFRTVDTGDLSLVTNGKPDASLSRVWLDDPPADGKPIALESDSSTQVLLALTTLAHKPDARRAAVVGFGSGVSSHFLLGSPQLQRLTTVEIEPAMVQASRAFYPANRRAYDDPRSSVIIEDAKSFFAASPEPFDLILSEPSNPWVSGVSSLFGGEFYDVVHRRLADGGVFGQWLHLYEINDALVMSVLAALHEHFGDYQIFVVGYYDILIVATKASALPAPNWSVLSFPDVRGDLARFVPFTPAMLEATRFLNRESLAPLFELGYPPNSDFFPILDSGAESARFLHNSASGLASLSHQRFPLTAMILGRRPLAAETVAPVNAELLFQERARSARLRAAFQSGDFTPVTSDPLDSVSGFRLWQWRNAVVADSAPADWRLWVLDTIAIEADLHGAGAGEVDEGFYRELHAYMQRHGAPQSALDAIGFIEALARWNFAAAAEIADRLLADARADRPWVPVPTLLDGAVMSKLAVGDVEGARRFRDVLRRHSGREPGDARQLLMDAYLARSGPIAIAY